nr:DoxX family protein [Microvirga brassicacearum]
MRSRSHESQTMRDTLLLIGRVLLVVMFIKSGFDKFFSLEGTAAYIGSAGLPMPSVLAPLTAIAEFGLGLAILIGYQTRIAAFALAAFALLTIPFFHAYWNMTDQARMLNQIMAMKNVSLAGAFLLLAGAGAGRYSVDRS